MATARIDLEGMARLVGGLEDVARYVPGIRRELDRTLGRFSLPTDVTAPLAGVSGWAADRLPDVRRRLALARAIEERRPYWPAGTVEIDESRLSTMPPAEAQRAGRDAALALRDGRGVPDAELVRLMDEMSADPYFAAGFAGAVPPEDLARIVSRLSGNRRPLDGSQTYEENLASNAWYPSLVSSISRTVATATYGTGDLALPPDHARSWVAAITEPTPTDLYEQGTAQQDQAAALGLLLGAGGRFEESFVSTVAEGVYAYERAYVAEHGGKVWYPRTSGSVVVGAGIHDPSTTGVYIDPVVGVMTAVARHPELAVRFLNPDGGGPEARSRAEYLIEERTWSQDDFDAIARVLDVGGTVWHTADATTAQQQQSAWIASATVHHLAQRDGGRNDRRIGEAGKDSLGHLLGAYVADLDAVAQRAQAPAASVPGPADTTYTTAAWLLGAPVGAAFTESDLTRVLSDVMTDDTAAVRLAEAAAHVNAARMSGAVAEYEAEPTRGMGGPSQSAGRLLGYLAGNLEAGSVAAGKEVDERNKQFIGLASDLVGLIPTGRTVTSFLADQAKSAGQDRVTEELTGNAAAAAAQAEKEQEMTRLNLQIATAVALAGSRHIPDSARTDANGKVYPWFQEGVSVQAAVEDPATRSLFTRWMYDDAGDVADLLPDVSQAFDDGRGMVLR